MPLPSEKTTLRVVATDYSTDPLAPCKVIIPTQFSEVDAQGYTTLIGLIPAPGTITDFVVPFTFATVSPMVIQAINVGQHIFTVRVVITTSFDNPAAHIQVGTPAVPSLFTDIQPVLVGQYVDDNVYAVSAPETLRVIITPAASTQGAGYLFYSIRGV